MSTGNSPRSSTVPGKVWRGRGWSLRIAPRAIVVCIGLAAAILAVGVLSISIGDFPVLLADVWASLFGTAGEDAQFIVTRLRLPRVLVAILAGACFGMSGALFQSLSRNPLGSPDIIGFDAGAALGAVTVLVVTGGSTGEAAAGAVFGGLTTAVLVYALAWRRGVRTYRLVLIGLGMGFLAGAAIDYMITRGDILTVQRAALWLTGSLSGRGWGDVTVVGLALITLTPPVLVLNRRLRLLELGDDAAAGLGIGVNVSKLGLALVGVLLAALSVAVVGPVAFVAFVAGPVARRLVGTADAAVVPAAFVGAAFLLTADLVARRVIAPTELPVGITTAMVGAPFLIYLLTRQLRTGAL